jgi:CubicO group peptidase (beta-lactamase class C family)
MKYFKFIILLCVCAPQILNARDIVKSIESIKKFGENSFSNKTKGIRTESLLIVMDGQLVFEKYGHGFNQEMPHRVWSITKSFVNTIYGVAQEKGMLNIDDPVGKHLPEFNQVEHLKNVKLRHLLNMNSGIAWNESYTNPFSSNVIKMLYADEKKDMGGYALSVAKNNGLDGRLGESFKYSSGTSNLLMYIFKKIIGNLNLYNFWPWTNVFRVLGMDNVTWEQDFSGTFVGSSYLFMTPRNLLKFARLYMNKGVAGGSRVLPEGWVKQSVTPTKASSVDNDSYAYGLHFWTNAHANGKLVHKFLPKDTFFSLGHNGQILMMIPSKKIILIRMAHDTDKLNHGEFFKKFWTAYEGGSK